MQFRQQTESMRRSRTVCLLKLRDIEFDHLQHRVRDALRPNLVALAHHLVHHCGHDLPSQAKPVDQPTTRLRLASSSEERVPIKNGQVKMGLQRRLCTFKMGRVGLEQRPEHRAWYHRNFGGGTGLDPRRIQQVVDDAVQCQDTGLVRVDDVQRGFIPIWRKREHPQVAHSTRHRRPTRAVPSPGSVRPLPHWT